MTTRNVRKEIEKRICGALSNWFTSYDVKCWLNYGPDQFNVRGTTKKADLMIYSKRLKQYIVLEVKRGDISRDIYDAQKILLVYRKNYISGKTEYWIDGRRITVDSFAIATHYSPSGRLFKTEELQSIDDYPDDEWKKVNKLRMLEPLHEYNMSHSFLRQLWAVWRISREKERQPGLGIIVSNNLNREKPKHNLICSPVLFDQQWEEINDKGQWKVRQKDL